jgi:hypothetical protein
MRIRKRHLASLVVILATGSGVAFASNSGPGGSEDATTFSLAAQFPGYGVGYATTGASQVRGDSGGRSGTDCSAVNTASSSASLDVPGDATPVKAYLYWVGLEQSEARGYPNMQTVAPSVRLTRADGTSTMVGSARRMVAGGTFNGGDIQYAAYQADVTSFIGSSMSDMYNVAITGGIAGLCGERGENARAWQLVVVYDTPAPDYSVVYVYDGLEYLQHQTRSITISGFDGRSDLPSSLTTFVAQGDSTLPGEFTTNSDPSFPDYPENFAHESVNGGATGANGQAIDIATLTGSMTAGSTSMTLTFGTQRDVIVPTTFVLRIASNPPAVPPTTTTTAPAPTTTAPTTTAPATTVPTTTPPTTVAVTTTTAPAATTTTTVAPATTTTAPATTTTTTVEVVGTVASPTVPIALPPT